MKRVWWVLAGVAGLVTTIFTASLLLNDKWQCWRTLTQYQNGGELYVEVKPGDVQSLLEELKTFSERKDMWFASDHYPPGGVEHDVYATQLFSCSSNIYIENNHAPSIFGVHFAYNPRRTNVQSEFAAIKKDIEVDVFSRFKRIDKPK